MKLIVLTFISLLVVFSDFSEDYDYLNDPNISDKLGKPANDSTFYFSLEHFIDSLKFYDTTIVKPDTFSVEWFSEQLRFASEPILYNYYLGKEIYRLTWLRSFHPDIVLRLENSNGEIHLIQKELTLVNPWKEVDSVTMVYKPDKFKLKHKVKEIDTDFWIEFENLLEKNEFQSMSSTVAWEMGTDGSEWILEKHSKNGYYVVSRWSPRKRRYSKFREIGDALIDKSIFRKQERY